MNAHQHPLAETRILATRFHELREEPAPEGLRPAVLSQLGLADLYAELETVLGPAFVAYNANGISAIMQAPSPNAFERAFRTRLGRTAHQVGTLPADLATAIRAEMHGESGRDLHYDLRALTPFERAVLEKTLRIPYGEVRPYSWVAREAGRPKAVRAAGTALARNPIPLLIPCHRVVAADGHIGNYGMGGSSAKIAVLTHEGVAVEQLERLARAGIRYLGSDTTHTYCYPTCRHARRISDEHRVPFSSAEMAHASGYRPCAVCRPAPSLLAEPA